MRIVYTKDYLEMSRKAAGIIAAQVVLKPASVLGLATGRSPLEAYKQLIEWYKKGDVDFKKCRTVNLDEYVGLGPEDPESYHSFMRENLFQHININPANAHIPNGKNSDAECQRYDDLLKHLGKIDLQLLGLGHNGHIAFNEPCQSISKGTHKVALTHETIEANKSFFTGRDMPRYAYSMGIKSILDAKRILLIVAGEEKAEILCRSLTGKIKPTVPASLLQLHSDLIVVADEAALSVLVKTAPELVSGEDLFDCSGSSD